MKCKKCGREIPAGQEVRFPEIVGVRDETIFCQECDRAATSRLLEDIFVEKPAVVNDEDDDEPTHDSNGPINYSPPQATMSCCGAEKKFDRADDEPCWNCGAI